MDLVWLEDTDGVHARLSPFQARSVGRNGNSFDCILRWGGVLVKQPSVQYTLRFTEIA